MRTLMLVALLAGCGGRAVSTVNADACPEVADLGAVCACASYGDGCVPARYCTSPSGAVVQVEACAPKATMTGTCQPGACSAGVNACRDLTSLVQSLCKPLPDGTCPVLPPASAEICNSECCATLTCVPSAGVCIPTMVDK